MEQSRDENYCNMIATTIRKLQNPPSPLPPFPPPPPPLENVNKIIFKVALHKLERENT